VGHGTHEKPHYGCPTCPKIIEIFEKKIFYMKKFAFWNSKKKKKWVGACMGFEQGQHGF
jgi:hypothetical protein